MSNGNERTNAGEANIPNFTDAAKVPQHHDNWSAKQPVQVAISNWVNSCGRADELSIEQIVDACWMLEPVVQYLALPYESYAPMGFEYRKQLVRMFIRQALISYIDTVIIASVPNAAQQE